MIRNPKQKKQLLALIKKYFDKTGGTEFSLSVAEAFFDQLLDEGIAKDIPVLSFIPVVAKIFYTANDVKETNALRELLYDYRFFSAASQETQDEILEKLLKTGNREVISQKITSLLSETEDAYKTDLQAAVLREYICGRMTNTELKDILRVINCINAGDLEFVLYRQVPSTEDVEENPTAFFKKLKRIGLIDGVETQNGGFKVADTDTNRAATIKRVAETWKLTLIPPKKEKQKKTPDELLNLIEKKGVAFNKCTKDDALKYILTENYYFRVAAYRENYKTNDKTNPKYLNLDFAFLIELSNIDTLLRSRILSMTAEIEQQIKVLLTSHFLTKNPEDGKDLIRLFLAEHEDIRDKIRRIDSGTYSRNLARKYAFTDCPLWVLVEMLSFRELIELVKFYEDRCKEKKFDVFTLGVPEELLHCVRKLRNAAAHNNCLINDLRFKPPVHGKNKVFSAVRDGLNISNNRAKRTNNRFIHDFICLLLVYIKIMPKNEKTACFDDWHSIDNRIRKHEEWFKPNNVITSAYELMKIIFEKLEVYCTEELGDFDDKILKNISSRIII